MVVSDDKQTMAGQSETNVLHTIGDIRSTVFEKVVRKLTDWMNTKCHIFYEPLIPNFGLSKYVSM